MNFMDLNVDKVLQEQNELNIKPMHQISQQHEAEVEKATFGMGCYWAAESLFGGTNGVLRTRVGYSGGKLSFSESDIGDHTEVVEIYFDPKIINYKQLLELFWTNQENDLKLKTIRKYMSLILYHNQDQKTIAIASKQEQECKLVDEISTEINANSVFYPANNAQQKYKLQQHKELVSTLHLTPELLQTSYVATKLNGFLVGIGGASNLIFNLGLTPTQLEYIQFYIKQNAGNGLSC